MKSKAGGRRGGLPRPALYGRGVIRMGEERGLLESLLLELRRGTLVLSVLSQMDVPRYGYSLVQCMEEKVVAIDPNTLYPLLRRLERQGLLESRWETDGPKPRKYYTRTPFGDEIFEALKCQWREMAAGVEGLLKKESRAACEAPRTGEGRRNDEPGLAGMD